MTIFAVLTDSPEEDAGAAAAAREAAEEARIRKLAREEARAALDEELPADDEEGGDA